MRGRGARRETPSHRTYILKEAKHGVKGSDAIFCVVLGEEGRSDERVRAQVSLEVPLCEAFEARGAEHAAGSFVEDEPIGSERARGRREAECVLRKSEEGAQKALAKELGLKVGAAKS